MKLLTRRRFVKATSAMGAAVLAAPSLVLGPEAQAQSADALIQSAPVDKAVLRKLAQTALDAAKAAGAHFADVRILLGHRLKIKGSTDPQGVESPGLHATARIGVRAHVAGGRMGFAGEPLTHDVDRIAVLARRAVERSKAMMQASPMELAPAPVVANGVWRTPIEIDPFTVPVGEHRALLEEAFATVSKFTAASVRMSIDWKRYDEIFASTEGSWIDQRIHLMLATGVASSRWPGDEGPRVAKTLGAFRGGSVGYEGLSKIDFGMECVRAAEQAFRLTSLPPKSIDVGRYDVVLSAGAVAALLQKTIGEPLQLDRALAVASSSKSNHVSYAMPPKDCLGKLQVGSPLITVTADRTRPGLGGTVGWDSEGVKPEEFPLVEQGTVVDYLTTRETAPELRSWYESRQQPLRSHGCASNSGGVQPQLKATNLALRAAASDVSEDDLIRDVKRGFYVDVHVLSVSTDHAGLNTFAPIVVAQEILNGRRTAVHRYAGLQFNTPQFWKSVDALGGKRTEKSVEVIIDRIVSPELLNSVGVTAVPVRARKVDIMNSGKSA